EKAMDFVLGGNVTLHEDGTATVKSGSHTYHLEPQCTCQDSQNRSIYCKHYLAVELLKRTYTRIGEHANGNAYQTAPQPQEAANATAWQCAQAPSSCTLKWAFNGIELMLTLRDATDDALFSRIKKVLPKIEERMELQRQQRQERQQAQNGNGGNNTTANTPAVDDGEPYCDFHDVPLKQYSKDGRSWYSHIDSDGKWCRGK
ncbi:MAG: SWIM zinc finger family protein, partial [bacterium]|nr:SWIM zinc finger family protein [bacterium]